LGKVRKLANTLLVELNPEIENLAGSTKARELLVHTSLGYLDSLAAEAGSDPALQLELAAAYEKIGDVQGNPLFANLGHPKASLESYAKALAIAGKLGTSWQVLEIVARSHYKIGCVYNWGLGRFSDAEGKRGPGTDRPTMTGQPAYRAPERADSQRMGAHRRWGGAGPFSVPSPHGQARSRGRKPSTIWRSR
jgi:hypothetical protein